MEWQLALINTGVGLATGFGVAIVGYLSNMLGEDFKFKKAIPTLVIGVVMGAITGFISADPKSAVIAALTGDVLRNALKNYTDIKNKIQATP